MMTIVTGTKVNHARYGEGIVSHTSAGGFKVIFKRGGEMSFSRLGDDFEVVEPGSQSENNNGLSPDDLVLLLEGVLEHYNGISAQVAPAEKWLGGTLILQPANPELSTKEIPIETLFHKIVMLRDRLRVLEQHINSHPKLNDADRVNLQQYITRCYGSLTSFNVLFKDKVDYFKGTGE
jgi:hypothetical protein